MASKSKAGSEWEIVKIYWKLVKKRKHQLWGVLLVPLGFIASSTLLPYYVGQLLATLSTDPDGASRFLPPLLIVGVIGILFNRFGIVHLFRLQARLVADLQALCLDTLLRHSVGFHSNRVAGKLVSDALDFPMAFQMLSGAFVLGVVPLILALFTGIVLVMVKSVLLGLILCGMVFVVIGVALLHSHRRKPLRKRRADATKAVTAHMADVIVNNQTVKTFAREEHERSRHSELSDALYDIRYTDWASGARAGNNRMIGLLVFQVIFAFVIIDLVRHDPSLLAIGIFSFAYSVTLSNNLISFNTTLRQIEDGFVQAAPMVEALKLDPEVQDRPDSTPLAVSKGAIKFSGVRFAYSDANTNDSVFDNLNLSIKAGEKIGLVGSSGGGKSTLTRILLRFSDIDAGTITIDGQDISQVTQTSLRQAIAYVPQEPLMFHRSVADNIAYGNPDATKEDIIAAARQAHAHDFITQLPKGYDTLVGERGVKLSGGQRQRVAIARAILKNAPILVLDEATSALDSESEVFIQKALQELMSGRTTLVIAHRLSTIQKMDRIIVLEDGKIAEEGTHKSLLQKKGVYAKLWAHQSGGFLES